MAPTVSAWAQLQLHPSSGIPAQGSPKTPTAGGPPSAGKPGPSSPPSTLHLPPSNIQEGASRISAAQALMAARSGATASQDPVPPVDATSPLPANVAAAIPAGQNPNPTTSTSPAAAPQTPNGVTAPPASDGTALPIDAIQAQLQQIQASTDLEATLKQLLVTAYESVLAEMRKRAEEEKTIKDFSTAIEGASNAIAEAKKRRDNPGFRSPYSEGTLPWSRVETLQAMQLDVSAMLLAATKARTDVETTMTSREARRKDIPRLITETKGAITKLTEELAVPLADKLDPRQREANQLLLRVKLASANSTLRRLELEQRMIDVEAELLPIRKELAIAEEKFYQVKQKEINEELGKRRENQIAKDRRKAEEILAKAKPPLEPDAKEVLQLVDDWLKMVKEHSSLRLRTDEAKAQQKQWADRYKNMTARLSGSSSSETAGDRGMAISSMKGLVGEILRRQRNELPDVGELTRRLEDYKTRLQSTQSIMLALDDWKAKNPSASDPTQPALDMESSIAEFDSLTLEQQQSILDSAERRIVDEFRLDANNYSDTLFSLAELAQQQIDQVKKYQSFIDEHILWIRSTEPFGKTEVSLLWNSIQQLCDLKNWKRVTDAMLADIREHLLAYALFVFGLAVLFLYTKPMRKMVQEQGAIAKKTSNTSFRPTMKVIVLSLLLAAPFTLLHLALGWRLTDRSGTDKFVAAVGMGFLIAARYFFGLEFLRQIVRPNGLAENHFLWSHHATEMLRRNLRWFIDLSIPLVALLGLLTHYSDTRWENSLGRVTFCLLMLVCTVVLLRLLHPSRGVFRDYLQQHAGGWTDRLRMLWYPGISLAPLVLMGMSLMGYNYTANKLAMHVHTTIMTLTILLLLYATIWRWLLLQRRQLVIAQARQRLEEARRRDADAAAGTASVAFETGSDLSQINAQTVRLLTSTMIVAAIAAVAVIWASILPAVGALDSVTLWTVAGDTPDERVRVTLANLLLAIPAAIMTMVAARNLPGLLEIALLQHLPIENAARYAIISISRYFILMLGIAMTFNSIGVRWASIQWLVAALGVGLGFGLQEIFGNFVSGLILLFEQPVRVGDVITVGDTTGTVSKIRMRATTVQNFDQQELIIPNKDLITGRLLNWTLSDSTNRLIIDVGVAYGTDVARACQILKEICNNHSNVLKVPEPTAFFELMADSQLTIKVRLFLASLDLRLPTRHDLLTEIHRRFAAEGIKIPFPQRDLHIRTIPPDLAAGTRIQAG